MFSDPQQKILTIKDHANTGFVHIPLDKRFYMRVEKITEELGSKPDIIISKMLLLTMKQLENKINTLDSSFQVSTHSTVPIAR